MTETARQLDLARSHVYNLIRAFGFAREGGERACSESAERDARQARG